MKYMKQVDTLTVLFKKEFEKRGLPVPNFYYPFHQIKTRNELIVANAGLALAFKEESGASQLILPYSVETTKAMMAIISWALNFNAYKGTAWDFEVFYQDMLKVMLRGMGVIENETEI